MSSLQVKHKNEWWDDSVTKKYKKTTNAIRNVKKEEYHQKRRAKETWMESKLEKIQEGRRAKIQNLVGRITHDETWKKFLKIYQLIKKTTV